MSEEMQFPAGRLRRLRASATLRDMLAEVRLSVKDLIAPIFVRGGENLAQPIASMPGHFQFSLDKAVDYAKRLCDKGLPAVLLFGVTDKTCKDETGSFSRREDAPVQQLTAALKKTLPELVVITDTCLCEYTSHGHCGPLRETAAGRVDVDNDATVELLAQTAVSQAKAGADIVAPSAMMDHQVLAIRSALDAAGFIDTAIMSYSVKFASSFYGPFRDAAESPPQHGDRKGYQMDFRSPRQALAELAADVAEGADMVMVKPAGAYLDVIKAVRENTHLPVAAYHVSGEYAMIKAAAEKGWLDEKACAVEATLAIRRAGADMIITYFAEQLAEWI